MTPRVRAPELRGRGWINTGGRRLSIADLRGKIVLLDFWTFCCVNCLHVLDELRPLEEKYADELVVIGVHSPKFEHERQPDAVVAAVERYGVTHPVLDDPDLRTWQEYTARAWPTLVVVDPAGYVAATMAGEGHAESLDRLIGELVTEHEERGTLRRGGNPYEAPPAAATALRYPGKVLMLPSGALLVSDTARHRLVEMAGTEDVIRVFGSGARGRADGAPAAASFNEPQGMCLLPDHVAEHVGYHVVVADTVNHLLRGVHLHTGEVTTVAGTGRPWRSAVDDHAHDALAVDLSSPWDVAWYDDRVIVAMAGIHQLWWYDPVKRTAGVYAGTTVEGLRDGDLPDVFMAQPSGLAVAGDRLWLVDAETSALRYVEAGAMHTAVGAGLFDFGHVDGAADAALFQHPLGVCALPTGTVGKGEAAGEGGAASGAVGDNSMTNHNSVAVADTYNGAIRLYDPATGQVGTLATGLLEPTDLVLFDGELIVVESAAHRLTRIPLAPATQQADGQRHRTERPPAELAAGTVTLQVVYEPPAGQKLDSTFGPPTRLEVTASPPELLVEGAGTGADLTRELTVSSTVDTGVLHVTAQAATCDAAGDNPACRLARQDWGVPVRLVADGPRRLALVLHGVDPTG